MMLDARARRLGFAEAHGPFSVEPISPLSSKYWVSLNIYEMPLVGPVRVIGHCRTGAGGAVLSMDADVPGFWAAVSDGTHAQGALCRIKILHSSVPLFFEWKEGFKYQSSGLGYSQALQAL
jgi:hypothetical protein